MNAVQVAYIRGYHGLQYHGAVMVLVVSVVRAIVRSDVNALLFVDIHVKIPYLILAWVSLEISADLIEKVCTYSGLVQFPTTHLPVGHPLRDITSERKMDIAGYLFAFGASSSVVVCEIAIWIGYKFMTGLCDDFPNEPWI